MLSGGVHHLGDAGVRGVHGLDWVYGKKGTKQFNKGWGGFGFFDTQLT